MTARVDLKQLVVDRGVGAAARPQRRPSVRARFIVPAVILVGFVGVIGWSLRDSLLPTKPVTIVPVVVARAEVQQVGTTLFQAAGWVEPRPTAVMATALVEGVVGELLVVEGQAVEKGQPVAQLVDDEARMAAADAEATLKLRAAELESSRALLTSAQSQLEQPVHLQAALAESEAVLAKLETEINNLPFAIRAAQARSRLAKQDLDGKLSVAEAVPGRSIQRAQSEFESAAAAEEELVQRAPNLEIERDALHRKTEALKRQLQLRTEEHRKVVEAQGNVEIAAARFQQAELAVEAAKLRVNRMTVRAPISGRVLSLNAQPGRRLMGINAASERDASTVVSLYDPGVLQVRADVRLEDVAHVQPGQAARITSAALKAPLVGEVITATSLADIQKNTLQVKIAIVDPPAVIKPEMLVQVEFLAPQVAAGASPEGHDPLRMLVPKQLVIRSGEEVQVWVADLALSRARRANVVLGKAGTDALVEVSQGLTAMDKLIVVGREGLRDGDRIRIVGEDTSLGIDDGNNPVSAAESNSRSVAGGQRASP